MGSAMQAQVIPYIINYYDAKNWEVLVYILIYSIVGLLGIVLYLISEIYLTKSFNFYCTMSGILSVVVESFNFFISYNMLPNLWHRMILSILFPGAICMQ